MSGRRKRRLLDLYCCAGGGAAGYLRGGFDEVVGVDKLPQPNYPWRFVQKDALAALVRLLSGGKVGGYTLKQFTGIHASPPCQRYSQLNNLHKDDHPDLVEPTRELLELTGLPYIMENVPGAPLVNYVVLCGGAFGLGSGDRHLRRHRLFELSFPFRGLVPPCHHWGKEAIGVYGDGGRNVAGMFNGKQRGYMGSYDERQEAMDIDWMTRREMSQAIPPAMTEFLAPWLLAEAEELERAQRRRTRSGAR